MLRSISGSHHPTAGLSRSAGPRFRPQQRQLRCNARPDHAGVFKVSAEVRRGATPVGTASASVLVGGADLEMTDPRLNRALLERLATRSGGRLLTDNQVTQLPDLLGPCRMPRWSFGAICGTRDGRLRRY